MIPTFVVRLHPGSLIIKPQCIVYCVINKELCMPKDAHELILVQVSCMPVQAHIVYACSITVQCN